MKINPTFINSDNLVGEWLFNGNPLDTSSNGNDGTASNMTWVSADRGYVGEVGSFNGTNGKVNFGNIGNVKSISFFINLTTTTENIFEKSAGSGVSVSSGTLSYTNWDNAFINTVDTDTITTGWTHIVLTSTTDVNLSAFQFGLISSTYGDFDAGLIRVFSDEIPTEEIKTLYQEGLRNLGPTALLNNNTDFQRYSLKSLEDGKVLSITRPVVSGTYYDQTGNGNNGTNNGVADTTSGLNNIMDFNGSSDYIEDSSSSITSNTTLSGSAKIKFDSIITNDKTIMADFNYSNNRRRWIFYRENSVGIEGLYFRTSSTGNTNNGDAYIPASYFTPIVGKRYHLAFTYNAGVTKIFINGIENTNIIDNTVSSLYNTPTKIYTIGVAGGAGTYASYFDGEMCNPTIWDRVLTPQEVQQDFYSNFIS